MRQTLSELETHQNDYRELSSLLDDLPKKARHEIVVPFGTGAFFLGELRHTNEVVMHLGDAYFAERTVPNAQQTVNRFVRQIDSNIAVQRTAIEKIEKKETFLKNAKAMNVDPNSGCRRGWGGAFVPMSRRVVICLY